MRILINASYKLMLSTIRTFILFLLVFLLDHAANQTVQVRTVKEGSLKKNTALEYSTRVVQEGGRRCKKSTLNDLVHLTPLRIPLMNPP